MKKNYWGVKPLKFNNVWKPKQIKTFDFRLNFDTDKDGVKDWKDCKPFDWRKQDKDYDEFEKKVRSNIKRKDIIKVVDGYGIYKAKYPSGKMLYYAMDMNTGLTVLNNRPSLKGIIREVKEGVPEEVRKMDPSLFDIKRTYEITKVSAEERKKYGGRAKRFSGKKGQKVLDIGGGANPDYRATHVIDLRYPKGFEEDIAGLDYKYGYDFNKETTDLPYNNNSFDVVVSYGALGRNFWSKNIFAESYRVLKPGGHFELHSTPETKKDSIFVMKKVGFKNISIKSYYDKALQENIPVIFAWKV